MPIERDFLALMPHQVTIQRFTGRDLFGQPQYGPPEVYRARVVGKQRLVRSRDGTEKVSATQVYVFGAPAVSVEDRITLPDGSQPPILAVSRVPDETGDHHVVIYCG